MSWWSRHAEKPQHTVEGRDAAYWFVRWSDERRAIVERDKTLSLNATRIFDLEQTLGVVRSLAAADNVRLTGKLRSIREVLDQ